MRNSQCLDSLPLRRVVPIHFRSHKANRCHSSPLCRCQPGHGIFNNITVFRTHIHFLCRQQKRIRLGFSSGHHINRYEIIPRKDVLQPYGLQFKQGFLQRAAGSHCMAISRKLQYLIHPRCPIKSVKNTLPGTPADFFPHFCRRINSQLSQNFLLHRQPLSAQIFVDCGKIPGQTAIFV